jgi:hypothetical protein
VKDIKQKSMGLQCILWQGTPMISGVEDRGLKTQKIVSYPMVAE